MKGPPVGGTAADESDIDLEGTREPARQDEGRASTAGQAGSGGDSGWSEPDWDPRGGNQLVGATRRKAREPPCHGRCYWCLHPGDQTRLEVAAGP